MGVVLGFLVAFLTAGAAAAQDAAATRLLVSDAMRPALHAIDPASGSRLSTASVPAREITPDRSGSRLIAFWTEPKTRIEHATILDRASLRTIGDVALGVLCGTGLETADARHFAILCSAYKTDRKAPDQRQLFALDLQAATLTGKLPVPYEATLLEAADGRLLIVAGPTSSSNAEVVLAARLPNLENPTRLELPCRGDATRELLRADTRRLFVRCDAARLGRDQPVFPSTIMVVDVDTLAPPRVVPLGEQTYGIWSFTDGRYIYVANRGTDTRPGVEPALVVFSTEHERVIDRLAVSGDVNLMSSSDAGWPTRQSAETPILVRSSNSVLAVRDGRVLSTTGLPGKSPYPRFTVDSTLGRLYVTRDPTLLALDLRSGGLLWSTAMAGDGELAVAPDGARGVRQSEDDVAVVDLQNGAVIAQFKSSTKGARARLFWKDLGTSLVALQAVNSATSTGVAFSAIARRTIVLAPTGEAVLVDLGDGRIVARVPDRAAALLALPRGNLALLLSPKQVRVYDMLAGVEVQKLVFADAPGAMPPHLALSGDGTRIAVGWGSTVLVLDTSSGRVVSSAKDFGRVADVRFLD